MKLSVSLPDDDVNFPDSYGDRHGFTSRSAALKHAIGLLRASELGAEYEDAWTDWSNSEDSKLWDSTSGDFGDHETVASTSAKPYWQSLRFS